MAETSPRVVLGIEGGGTKTDWVLLDQTNRVLGEGQLPPTSLKLIDDTQLARIFARLPREVSEVGVFLAGCLLEHDRARVRRLASAVWPDAKLRIGSDSESGLATALGERDGIVVISGTGAVVHGRHEGRVTKAGGWGHILGDRGGGYDLARHALRKVMLRYDLAGDITPLGARVLAALSLNELPQLVDWIQDAGKMDVARLAPVVIQCARDGEAEWQGLVSNRARDLAFFTQAVARRLGLEQPEVRLFGGLLTREPYYADLYREHLRVLLPGAHVDLCPRSGAFGAAALARGGREISRPSAPLPGGDTAEFAAAATEQLHARAAELEQLSTADLVALFVEEEDSVRRALAACAEPLARGVESIATALRAGGRLFYAGAGTSGRLGVLDASEMPPTFGTPPELVQGIMAGGAPALTRSAEAAEDSAEAGALAMEGRGVQAGDVVCGITASGRTPFVFGALAEARARGATTLFLTCNPQRRPSPSPWDVEIDLPTGPEIVAGSTRLKAGTATKAALNLLSTGAMIRLGRVRGGAMIDVRATNVKLRDRAVRIVSKTLGLSAEAARTRLERHGWNVRAALTEP